MRSTASFILLACLAVTGCAGTIAPPKVSPASLPREALIILPGFGYSSGGERAIRALAPEMRHGGLDLHVPRYIRRSGLDSTREQLQRSIGEQRFDRYERVHVFAFIAGAWTFNDLARDANVLPNLATVVYDRSPYQERAPRIAADNMALLSWLRFGSVLFDIAAAPYAPFARPDVRTGLIVETVPTGFVKRFRNTARAYGPYRFACGELAQPHDDCIYAALNHNEMYTRFEEIWPELRTFIRDGRFSAAADRTAPEDVR